GTVPADGTLDGLERGPRPRDDRQITSHGRVAGEGGVPPHGLPERLDPGQIDFTPERRPVDAETLPVRPLDLADDAQHTIPARDGQSAPLLQERNSIRRKGHGGDADDLREELD